MNQTTNQNTLYRAQTPRTTEPVTIGGWYDHDDGTVGLYRWTSGQLHLVRTVASWADVAVETYELVLLNEQNDCAGEVVSRHPTLEEAAK